MKKLLLLLASLLLFAIPARSQGVVQGGEVTVSYTGTNAQLVNPNTPASNFNVGTATGGTTNTFIIPISNPTVSIRVYLTNNTANICASAFSIQMFSATDSQTSSFNNQLSNWQTVLLQNPSGGLAPVISGLTIPASGSIYISSSAIVSPRVAIQIVNQTSGCASTTLEATAVITQVAVSSPLISAVSSSPFASGNQVQGVAPSGSSANLINPVLVSGAGPPVNSGFTISGLDTYTPLAEVKGFSGTGATVTTSKAPVPTQGINELSLAIYTGLNGSCGSKVFNPVWTLQGAQGGPTTLNAATMFPAIGSTLFTYGITTPCTWTNNTQIGTVLDFNATGILTFNAGVACCAPAITAPNNPAGATIVIIVPCPSATACSVTSISDTLGMNWAQIESFSDPTISGAISGIVIWANTSSNPGGADTVTVTATGSPTVVGYATLSGITTATLVQQQIPYELDALGGEVMRMDAIAPNQWLCDVTLTTVATTQCLAAPGTINGVPVRAYVTDIQIYTSAAGTATTVSLRTGTGTNCASNALALTQMQYANTTVGMTSAIGFRTPFVAPLQTAVCAVQTGTTPGTSIVELHGFYAP